MNANFSSQDGLLFGLTKEETMTFQQQCNDLLDACWKDWRRFKSYMIPPIFSYKHSIVSDEDFQAHLRVGSSIEIKHQSSDKVKHIVYDAIFQLIQDSFQAPFIVVHSLNMKMIMQFVIEVFPQLKQCIWHYWENCLNELLQVPEFQKVRFWKDYECDIDQIFQTAPNSKILEILFRYFSKKMEENVRSSDEDYFRLVRQILRRMKTYMDNLFQDYDFFLIGPKIGVVVIDIKCSQFSNMKDFSS